MSRPKRDWREKLTTAEKKRLLEIERLRKEIMNAETLLRVERTRIQNRASVRAGK